MAAMTPPCSVCAPLYPSPPAVCTGLVVATKLISAELINAVLPLVLERLHHPKEHVRKKAVMVLHRCVGGVQGEGVSTCVRMRHAVTLW